MTRVFTEAGEHVPVTVLKLDGCQVVAHRTKEKNGYTAVQVGIGRGRSGSLQPLQALLIALQRDQSIFHVFQSSKDGSLVGHPRLLQCCFLCLVITLLHAQ